MFLPDRVKPIYSNGDRVANIVSFIITFHCLFTILWTRLMNRSYSRKSVIKKPNSSATAAPAAAALAEALEKANTEAQESVIVNNPASQAKLDLIKEKLREVEETNKLKESSAQMVQYFHDLSDGIKDLTESAQGVSKTFENWDDIFSTMGEMNKTDEKTVWVRFKKSTLAIKETGNISNKRE
jgi:F0F1-type ATP synthase membrane subunit b/b'